MNISLTAGIRKEGIGLIFPPFPPSLEEEEEAHREAKRREKHETEREAKRML
jgi:hypothetical protein